MLRLFPIDTLHSNRIFFICLAAFIPVHFMGIGDHGFWYDETITGAVSFYSIEDIIRDRLTNGHFPTYFILLKFWGDLFGKSEVSLRLPSLFFMTGAFGALWLICRRYFALVPGAAILALTLFFFHPTVFRLSQEARMYGPLLCLTLFSSYFFLVYLETTGKKPLTYSIIFLMAAITVHAQAFILLFAQASYLLLNHRRLFAGYLVYLAVPLILFLLLWKNGTADYSVYHRPANFTPEALQIIPARAGLIAAGESDAYIFRVPPWSKLTWEANSLFFLFFTSSLFWLFKGTLNAEAATERREEGRQIDRLAFSYLVYLLVVFYVVLIVLGILNFREPHRIRYQITVFPVLLFIVSIGALNLGALLQKVWQSCRKIIYGTIPTSLDGTVRVDMTYILSRCFAGCIFLAFASLYLYAFNIQVNWKGPGYKETILLIKDNYRKGDSVITSSMPNMNYGFEYFNAVDIPDRLDLNVRERNALSRKDQDYPPKIAAAKKVRRLAEKSRRVWLLFYRVVDDNHMPIIRAFEDINPEFTMFFNQEFPFAQLRGYERDVEQGIKEKSRE